MFVQIIQTESSVMRAQQDKLVSPLTVTMHHSNGKRTLYTGNSTGQVSLYSYENKTMEESDYGDTASGASTAHSALTIPQVGIVTLYWVPCC